jgi:hypothetical protein
MVIHGTLPKVSIRDGLGEAFINLEIILAYPVSVPVPAITKKMLSGK